MIKIEKSFSFSPEFIKNLFPLASLLIVVLLTAFFLFPTFGKTKELMEENKKIKKKKISLETKLEELKKLNQESIGQNSKILAKALPSKKPMIGLFATLSRISREENLELAAFSLKGEKEEEEEPVKQTPPERILDFEITFEVAGERGKILSFLEKLTKSAPLCQIKSLTLKTGEEGTKGIVALLVYYQRLPEEMISPEMPLEEFSPEEEKILQKLTEYKIYETIVPETITTGKEDLFGD